MNCTQVPAQMPPSLIHSLYAKYFLQNLDVRLVLFFFLISHVSICRIKSVERDFSLSRNVVKLVCSTFPQFFAAAYLLTFPVLRWEHCQKEVVWQLVSESTSHFAIRGFFSVMPIRTLTIVRHQGRNPFLNLAKEPGGCCRYRNSEL